MVLGLAHFSFCHTSSPQKPASPYVTHTLSATLHLKRYDYILQRTTKEHNKGLQSTAIDRQAW